MSRVIAIRQGQPRAVIMAGLRGQPGAAGEQGTPFQVDATGLLANRGAFDDEPEGFAYLATDTGDLYFRQGAAGNWSDPVPFQGPAGESAYQIAVNNGFVGTEAEWLEALAGADGTNGTDGADGLSITGATIDVNGHLLLTLSNSTVLDAGYVVGPAGEDGVDGTDGTNGTDGRGIASMAIDGSNHLIITYTDSTTEDAGLIPGSGGSAVWGGIGGTLSDQTDLADALAEKVDTVAGKGLSTEDYTTAEKAKLGGVAAGATANANTDSLAEGATNLYHTAARVRDVLLTGFSLADSTVVAATDSVLQAIGKLAARLALAFDRANHTGTQAISTVTGLQTALDGKAAAPTVRTISGTSGTLVPSDAGNIVLCTSSDAVTLSIQLESTAAWPAAAAVTIVQQGAGVVTIADGSGITVNVYSGLTKALRGQYAPASLIRTAADTFTLAGTLGGTPA
ncbi:hypothetical protein [Ectopseudomonas toyotomiensis]|uniref:Uncharacterized protein n=1 Tax=Ectopseudomonas toyotomiensis TaxID=554344 RepID=A0AA42LJQ5_9GAMM|nr:hypothetical protein [Pseudomonas toyotomiensis]MBG0839010.1 hypothetical protein [Pseudomonas toyotomiensis]MDH0699915.1 hypothetical protein [Pseudomonas toyotomiensis]